MYLSFQTLAIISFFGYLCSTSGGDTRICSPSQSRRPNFGKWLVISYHYWYTYGCFRNRGTPKSSILIGFSLINLPFWGTPIFGNTHILCQFTNSRSLKTFLLTTRILMFFCGNLISQKLRITIRSLFKFCGRFSACLSPRFCTEKVQRICRLKGLVSPSFAALSPVPRALGSLSKMGNSVELIGDQRWVVYFHMRPACWVGINQVESL